MSTSYLPSYGPMTKGLRKSRRCEGCLNLTHPTGCGFEAKPEGGGGLWPKKHRRWPAISQQNHVKHYANLRRFTLGNLKSYKGQSPIFLGCLRNSSLDNVDMRDLQNIQPESSDNHGDAATSTSLCSSVTLE